MDWYTYCREGAKVVPTLNEAIDNVVPAKDMGKHAPRLFRSLVHSFLKAHWFSSVALVSAAAWVLLPGNPLAFLAASLAVVPTLALARMAQRLRWAAVEGRGQPKTNVKDDARYQDPELLNKAWAQPSAAGYLGSRGGITFQPREGYCGLATFNTGLRSLMNGTSRPYLQIHALPRYVQLHEATLLLRKVCCGPNAPLVGVVSAVQEVPCDHGYRAFMRWLMLLHEYPGSLAVMAMFARAPLFFPQRRLSKFAAAHWSPIVSYIPDEDLALVMDVNRKYGDRGYLVPSRRLYDAVNSKCLLSGKKRGLVLLWSTSGTGDAGQLSDSTEIGKAFADNKEQYYRHVSGGSSSTRNDVDKLISFEDSDGVVSVASHHPFTFTNSIIRVDVASGPPGGRDIVALQDTVRERIARQFASRWAPCLTMVRGCRTAGEFAAVRDALTGPGGLVQVSWGGTETMILRLLPCRNGGIGVVPTSSSTMASSQCKRDDAGAAATSKTESFHLAGQVFWAPFFNVANTVPAGYILRELQTGDTEAIVRWGKTVALSYGFEKLAGGVTGLDGMSPGQFLGKAYSSVAHGAALRTFVCVEEASGDIVATSTLFLTPPTAAIYNVSTLASHRKRGLGKIMSLVVVREAAKAGCLAVLLEASPSGRPVYEKIGFEAYKEEHAGRFVRLRQAAQSSRWWTAWVALEGMLTIRAALLEWCKQPRR